MVKNAIIVIDGTPFRQWYESHYILPLGRKREAKLTQEENDVLTKKRSAKVLKKYTARQKQAKVDAALEEQFASGRLLGKTIFHYLVNSLFKDQILKDEKIKAIHELSLISYF